MNNFDLTNHFLIAMPNLVDPNFHQTVAYMCAHNEDGAMGIVINRPMGINLSDILSQLKLQPNNSQIGQQVIFQGGPVQRDRGFIIHRPLIEWDSTIKVSEQLAVATSRDVLEAISQGDGPDETLIALGYSGWGAGQLEQEIADNAWLASPADEDILFRTPVNRRWRSAAALLGIDVEQISLDVGHA